ncbi:MAG: EpsI family protein [Phycisphaerae bacterium]|nr:EpsI family protein [Phycisphaerae bacterium]
MRTTPTENLDSPPRSRSLAIGAWLLLAVALVMLFCYNFYEMWYRWFPAWNRDDLGLYGRFVEGESYYTHGPLILLVSIVISIILVRRTKIHVCPNTRGGIIVITLSLILHVMATLARVNFVSGFAFIGVITGLVLLIWGNNALRRLWFPIVFLVFMIPLPEVSVAQINFRLKMTAAQWGVWVANQIGIIAYRDGNRVFLEGDKSLIIANVCNGLRTMISLLAFGALYTYVCRLRGWLRLGLFAMIIPVALIANTIRIVSLIFVAHIWNESIATGWYHDTSSALIFVLAFLLMFMLERLIIWIRVACGRPIDVRPLLDGVRRGSDDAGQGNCMKRALGDRRVWVIGVIMAAIAVPTGWIHRISPPRISQSDISIAIPQDVVIDGVTMHSRDVKLDRRTLTILEFPGYVNRVYSGRYGNTIEFCMLYSQDNRKGIHPPDLCLEGGGSSILGKGDVVIGGVESIGEIPARELIVKPDIGPKRYVLYTYMCNGKFTRSFWTQQGSILFGGLFGGDSGGAMIKISLPITTEVTIARSRAFEMMRIVIPEIEAIYVKNRK